MSLSDCHKRKKMKSETRIKTSILAKTKLKQSMLLPTIKLQQIKTRLKRKHQNYRYQLRQAHLISQLMHS